MYTIHNRRTRSYPIIDAEVEKVLLSRANLAGDFVPFTFSKFNNQWIYIVSTPVEHEEEEPTDEEEEDKLSNDTGKEYSGPLGRVEAFSICMLCKVGFYRSRNPRKRFI